MATEQISWLMRGYLAARNSSVGNAIDISDAGAAGLIRFGKQLIAVGVALLLLCAVLPADGRRLIFIGMALVTCAAGVWHVANARAIVLHAREAMARSREV